MARKTKILLLAALILVFAGAPALAARGGDPVTGTIALHREAGATLAANNDGVTYGESITFDTTVGGKMAPKSTVYITVVCLQGDAVVYQYSANLDAAFPLADQPGQGLDWDGGDADCSATLIYKVRKGKSYDLTWLDTTDFLAHSA